MKVGCFGVSTGAAAALIAAAQRPGQVQAVVSRGGRPNLAEALTAVTAPTPPIVGGADPVVLGLNPDAQHYLRCETRGLEIVQGATHLFEEPGALEQVADLACDWLLAHMTAGDRGVS